MTMEPMIILDDGAVRESAFVVDDGVVRLPATDLAAALGWTLEEQGLCRGDVCIPVRDEKLATDAGVSLTAVAAALDRPLAIDPTERAAYLGVSSRDRSAALTGLVAPDFALPDLHGRRHSLTDHRGSKVLLVAWASW